MSTVRGGGSEVVPGSPLASHLPKREQRERLQGHLPESQGQNLALTALRVPYSLDMGGSMRRYQDPRRARIQGSTCVPHISRLESHKEEEKEPGSLLAAHWPSVFRAARPCSRVNIACAPRRITREMLKLRAVHFGTVLDSRTTTSQKGEAVLRRARI